MGVIVRTTSVEGAGYLLIDNTASGGVKIEDDIFTCGHCEKVLRLSQWKEEGGFCGRCQSRICCNPADPAHSCAHRMDVYGCEVFKRQIDRILDDNHRRAQNLKALTAFQ